MSTNFQSSLGPFSIVMLHGIMLLLVKNCREKVIVPLNKPYVSFVGNESSETVISWNSRASDRGSNGQFVGTLSSASVAIESDYFCARGITFEVNFNIFFYIFLRDW